MRFKLVESYKHTFKAYHGSPYKFNQFSLSNFGKHDAGQYGRGVYLTNKKEIAKGFTEGKDGYIYTCEVHLNNPLIVEADKPQRLADLVVNYGATKATETLKEQGYDGIIVKNDILYNPNNIFEKIIADQYVIFDPKNIEIIEIKRV